MVKFPIGNCLFDVKLSYFDQILTSAKVRLTLVT